jgi:signal transduction histidine kinase/ActR/RegA family two-component response regulator
VPLLARGRILGVLSFAITEAGRTYGPDDQLLAADLASRAALALDNARLYGEAQREIARRAQLEEELREHAAELAEVDRRKNEFVAALAHELRNPLVPILGALEMLRPGAVDPAGQERMRMVAERQAQHVARLLDDLLDISRIARGGVSLVRAPLDLARLVRDAVASYAVLLADVGLSLELHLPEEPVWIDGDATRLTQVLYNLMQNAIRFSEPPGRIELKLATLAGVGRSVPNPHGEAVLTVRDTGIGIPPDVIPHIFEAFAQADASRGGLGLGLAMVKGLVELHGGEVGAESRGDRCGTRIWIRLPMLEASSRLAARRSLPEDVTALSGEPRAASRERSEQERALNLLIIEDNRDVAETLRGLLTRYGHTVAVAYSGAEGVRLARELQPEVVISDLRLSDGYPPAANVSGGTGTHLSGSGEGCPCGDGYAVARALRGDPLTAGARLIALTGYGQEVDRCRSEEAGFDLHLTKPVRPAALRQILQEVAALPRDERVNG